MKSRYQKQDEAKARQEEYSGLSLDEKLARAKASRGQSKKQIARLLAVKNSETEKSQG